MQAHSISRVLVALGIALVSGCGSQQVPGAVAAPAKIQVAPVESPPPTLTDAGREGWQQLQALRGALAGASAMSAEFEASSAGYYNGGRKEKSLRRASSRSKLLWAAPERLRVEVLQSATAALKGGVLATPDGQVLWAKGGGVLSLVPIKLDASDPRLASNRNHAFRDGNPIAQLRRLTAKGASWLPKSGAPGVMEVTGVPRLDGEIDAETVTVDPASGRVAAIAAYSRGEKVTEIRFAKQTWNPPIAGDPFRL
ncbi:MAG: hypothetical protein FJZ01_28465 [Candidatus Sericytochromatia bacterium]|nr:hypothetical protein [Candidatus Tanganyikabacteria bacterium]